MDQSRMANGRVSSSKVPPPLPPNPPRSLPRKSSRNSSSTSSSPLSSACSDKLPSVQLNPTIETNDGNAAPPPSQLSDSSSVAWRAKDPAVSKSLSPPAIEMVFKVVLQSTPLRHPDGSLLGIGRRNAMLHSTEVKDADGIVYRRNPSGVYFQVEQPWSSYDGGHSLDEGDEVLAVDNYKIVDMSLDTARILLEDQARSGSVALTVARQPTDPRATIKFDSIIFDDALQLHVPAHATGNCIESVSDGVLTPTAPSAGDFTVDLPASTTASLGISLYGGLDANRGPSAVFIRTISPDSLTACDGRLRSGDEIMEVNGRSVTGLTNEQVHDLMQHHNENGGLRITARRHVQQRTNSSAEDAIRPQPPPRRRRSNVDSLQRSTAKSSTSVQNNPTRNGTECKLNSGNCVESEREDVFQDALQRASDEHAACDDIQTRMESNDSAADAMAENKAETQHPVTTPQSNDDHEQNKPTDDAGDDVTAPLDWNANKSSEICVSDGHTGDMNVVAVTECTGDEDQPGVRFSSDEESTWEAVTQAFDETSDSVAFAMVTASASYSPVSMTDTNADDLPPPLPGSLPPTSSVGPPLDQNQLNLLSVSVDGNSEIIAPPSPYASPKPESEADVAVTGSTPAAEQPVAENPRDEDGTGKYCTLSDEDRLLVQRILQSTAANSESETAVASEQTTANEQSEEKYSGLTESEHRLIESTLATLGPDAQSAQIGSESLSSASLSDLQTAEDGDKITDTNDGGDNTNPAEMEIQERLPSQEQEPSEDASKDVSEVAVKTTPEEESMTSDRVVDVPKNQIEKQSENYEEPVNVQPHQSATTVASNSEELSGDSDKNPVKSLPAEPSVVHQSQITCNIDTGPSNTEEPPATTDQSISDLPAAAETTETSKEIPVEEFQENDAERADNEDELSGSHERSTNIDSNDKPTDDVFNHSNVDSVHSDAHNSNPETNALSKSRRVLVSDEAVSGILRDYYTADAEIEEQKPPEKPKPVKPLIAQALLPKASRRPVGTSNSGGVTTGVQPPAPASRGSEDKTSRDQIDLAPAVTAADKSGLQKTEDSERLKLVTGQDSNGNVCVHASVTADSWPDEGDKKLSGSDTKQDHVPTIAESRAFFKSREAGVNENFAEVPVSLAQSAPLTTTDTAVEEEALKTQKRKPGTQRLPGSYSASWQEKSQHTTSTVATSLWQAKRNAPAHSFTNSSPPKAAAVPTREEREEISLSESSGSVPEVIVSAAAVVPTTSSPCTTSVSTTTSSESLQTEFPKLANTRAAGKSGDGGSGPAARAPLTTRWVPKPFSLTSTTKVKSTPTYMTFQPVFASKQAQKTTEFEEPADEHANATKRESNNTPSTSAENAVSTSEEETDLETSSTGAKVKQDLSPPSVSMAVGSFASADGSSAAELNVAVEDAARSSDIVDSNTICEASPADTQVSVSEASADLGTNETETETTKRHMSADEPSISTQPEQSQVYAKVGRSFSMTEFDDSPKLEGFVSKSKHRGPPTLAKSWMPFDHRKMSLGGAPVASGRSKLSSSDVDEKEEHISVASSKAFFLAAEQQQAANQPAVSKGGKKPVPPPNAKIYTTATQGEPRSSAADDVFSSSSSDPSLSTQITRASAAETTTTGQARTGPVQRPSFSSTDVTSRSKAWKHFMSNYAAANKNN